MESYLMITQINDFLFCPRSIYFHTIFAQNVDKDLYQDTPQKKGCAAHQSIDEKHYSTRKNILQGLTVYCEKYNLLGVIDTLDLETKTLCEQKYAITRVYDGFRYQLYAQYFALLEMGYEIEHLKLYSKKDNKSYLIDLPNELEIQKFESLLNKIRSFSLFDPFIPNPNKCQNCIYNPLCDMQEVSL